jgi:hypothetical protein
VEPRSVAHAGTSDAERLWLEVECGKAKDWYARLGEAAGGYHDSRHIVSKDPRQERDERWGDLCGPDAATRRLQDIETHRGQVCIELREIGRWTEHSACPDISTLLKRAQEVLNDAEREVRHARTRRLHG